MAAPLSLKAARGRPRFWKACDRPWAMISAVYADRRTMPSGSVFPRIRGAQHVIGSA
jgi:hypothetical protein